MKRPVPRRAGSPWRILVHQVGGDRTAYDVTSTPERDAHTVLPGTEFDELVIGKWIHLEQMDTGRWWMNVGGVTINVTADRDGNPKRVDVYGPGDYGDPVEGCSYEVAWTTPGRNRPEGNAKREQFASDFLDDVEKLRRQPPEGTAPLVPCRRAVL